MSIGISLVFWLIISGSIVFSAEVKEGVASWYGGGEKLNKYTANGDVFNPEAFMCASWHYEFGTDLRVTNLANGKSIFVRCNDRGPSRKYPERIIDLTKAAFQQIADLRVGLINVTVEVIE